MADPLKALDYMEKVEAERDRYREALEAVEIAMPEIQRLVDIDQPIAAMVSAAEVTKIARKALGPKDGNDG